MSKSLDPDQARHVVGPDLGSSCLQRLSAEDTSRLELKEDKQRINMLLKRVTELEAKVGKGVVRLILSLLAATFVVY